MQWSNECILVSENAKKHFMCNILIDRHIKHEVFDNWFWEAPHSAMFEVKNEDLNKTWKEGTSLIFPFLFLYVKKVRDSCGIFLLSFHVAPIPLSRFHSFHSISIQRNEGAEKLREGGELKWDGIPQESRNDAGSRILFTYRLARAAGLNLREARKWKCSSNHGLPYRQPYFLLWADGVVTGAHFPFPLVLGVHSWVLIFPFPGCSLD